MTCRAKDSSAIPANLPKGCSGSAVSARCGGGLGGGSVVAGSGFSLPQDFTSLPEREGLVSLPAESLCQQVFRGMKDSQDPQTADPTYARLIQNCYPLDSGMGARLVGRPGYALLGAQIGVPSSAFSSGFSSGFGGSKRVQGIYQYTKLSGTETTIVIAGGKLYHYTWATDTFTEKTLAAATLSAGGTCYFLTIADVVVISDGVNTPFTWDGTDDVVLTACPVLYGQPVNYYAKLFGIKNTERSTIVWCEEGDPTTGYEYAGYNNAWTLGQTDQDPLYALLGTNEALYYWRARSIGAIRGAVDADFINSGTREGVSQTYGSKSPDGIVVGGANAYFMDADNKVRSLSISGGRINNQIWQSLRETLTSWDETKLAMSRCVFDPQTNLVLVGVVKNGSNECNGYIAIDADSGEVAGFWDGWVSTSMAIVKDANGEPTIMHGSDNGFAYKHGTPDGAIWDDTNAAGDGGYVPITHKVTGAHLGAHMYLAKRFVRWDVSVWAETDMNLSLYYRTPRGTSTAQSKTVDLSTFPVEYHVSVGIDGDGRWILPTIEHANASERFGLERWCVTAVTYGQEPGIP